VSARHRGWIVGGLLILGAVGLVVARGRTSPDPPATTTGPRPVTAAEADRLAVMRFLIHRSTGVHFRTEVASAGGPLTIVGDVDYLGRVGEARVSGAGSSFTLQWTRETLLAWPDEARTTAPTARPLAPTSSAVDAVLALLLELGQDRPDNAQLIRENGATWLRAEMLGSTQVDVIQGPAAPASGATSGGPVTYWIDAAGNLLRLDARLGGSSNPTVISIEPTQYHPVTRSADLPP
jgi:hypothetical protein